MRCPFCYADNDKVIDTRSANEGEAIRRRRECLSCHRRFTTYERVEDAVLRVRKKDNSVVPFERSRLLGGIQKACTKRPVTAEQILELVGRIEHEAFRDGETEVSSQTLGQLVLEQLKQVDEVAYLRFASVYQSFDTAADFVRGVDPLAGDPLRKPR